MIDVDGQELGISNLLEHLYLDNNRELQQDFGPKVHEGPIRRRNVARHTFSSRDGTMKRTEASLLATLCSHSEAITGIAVSPDHMFFLTSSDDKTVKVWDTARLERNVTSKPRHTYGQHHARVKCVCILEGVHCFASAADDGSLHVVRVHTTQAKYNKLQVIREHRMDNVGEYVTCMTHFNTGTLEDYRLSSVMMLTNSPFQILLQILCMPQRILSLLSWTLEQCVSFKLWRILDIMVPSPRCAWIGRELGSLLEHLLAFSHSGINDLVF